MTTKIYATVDGIEYNLIQDEIEGGFWFQAIINNRKIITPMYNRSLASDGLTPEQVWNGEYDTYAAGAIPTDQEVFKDYTSYMTKVRAKPILVEFKEIADRGAGLKNIT